MEDTKVGAARKDDAADVAKTGYDAMLKGERSVVYGFKNKLQVAESKVLGGHFDRNASRDRRAGFGGVSARRRRRVVSRRGQRTPRTRHR